LLEVLALSHTLAGGIVPRLLPHHRTHVMWLTLTHAVLLHSLVHVLCNVAIARAAGRRLHHLGILHTRGLGLQDDLHPLELSLTAIFTPRDQHGCDRKLQGSVAFPELFILVFDQVVDHRTTVGRRNLIKSLGH
jgi:hypothetical protein